MFSPFHGYFHHVVGEAVKKYEDALANTNIDVHQIGDILMACLGSMDHPHIETTTIAAGMILPEHPDIMIKSRDGLAYAISRVFQALYVYTAAHGHGIALQWDRSTIPDDMPEMLPSPSLTCDEYGHKMTPYLAQLYENYFRRLDTLAVSEAEAERRKQEAERREKEAAAKRAAEAAKKAQRLFEERIARLEAEANRPYTKSGARQLPQTNSTSRVLLTMEQQAIHDHHVSDEEKARRKAIWEANQELAHMKAETKRLEKAYTEMRDE